MNDSWRWAADGGCSTVQSPLGAALADPWGALDAVRDGPLHPGGTEATEDLLDRAGVDRETRLLDVGCGAGESVALAERRGARAVGLDRDPREGGVRGDLTALPVRDASVDVVLAECVLCLAGDRSRALGEARRVLTSGGRLALSDVVVEGDLPDLPDAVAEALCLTDPRSRAATVADLERAGFAVEDARDHRDDLLAMRDRVAARVDYEGLLTALGAHGERLLAAVEDLEAAVESGHLGYVSLVATPRDGDGDHLR